MFLDSLHWSFSPRHEEILSIDRIMWLKLENSEKLNALNAGVGPFPDRKGYLFIRGGESNIYGGYSSGRTSSPERKYGVRYTLVYEGGPVMSWADGKIQSDKLAKVGQVRGLGKTGSTMIYKCYINIGKLINWLRG